MLARMFFLTQCIVLLVGANASAADCTPAQMIKIRYSNDVPGADPRSFAKQPKTLYRLGAKYGLIEELPDEPNRIHGLIVVSEPDIWIVNLAQNTGQHLVDGGPTYFFRAPVLSDAGSAFLSGLEFGCELAYMRAAGATASKRTSAGRPSWEYGVSRDAEAIIVTTDPDSERPRTVRFVRAGKEILTVRYLEYQPGLATNLQLFRKPTGIAFQEVK